jgi:hypothetical protein
MWHLDMSNWAVRGTIGALRQPPHPLAVGNAGGCFSAGGARHPMAPALRPQFEKLAPLKWGVIGLKFREVREVAHTSATMDGHTGAPHLQRPASASPPPTLAAMACQAVCPRGFHPATRACGHTTPHHTTPHHTTPHHTTPHHTTPQVPCWYTPSKPAKLPPGQQPSYEPYSKPWNWQPSDDKRPHNGAQPVDPYTGQKDGVGSDGYSHYSGVHCAMLSGRAGDGWMHGACPVLPCSSLPLPLSCCRCICERQRYGKQQQQQQQQQQLKLQQQRQRQCVCQLNRQRQRRWHRLSQQQQHRLLGSCSHAEHLQPWQPAVQLVGDAVVYLCLTSY